ncbi:NUDIX domain-containing protein [Natronosalvus halobius]|uniref:NUDIX domain-containing protein n=1 Tax=Natronosalvus halobius TaxID=2953746 RepID=UPI0020A1ECD2|nr:NUDIX domain-containing protein [Natronosalvus halobius]USZ70498.1 NUDIX domain-containing protein [Natronosalvus halobius]
MTDSPNDDGPTHVVTAFLRNAGEILLARRSDAVGTSTGTWGAVSGFAEGDPDAQVRREIAEETGIEDVCTLVRSGRPLEVTDADTGRGWVVHPYLFDCDDRDVDLSEEHDALEWVHPTAIPTGEYDTVPGLWAAYERVAPTVRSITADADHGAAWLSIRGLEVLRDRAGLLVAEREGEGEGQPFEGTEPGGGANGKTGDAEVEWDELATLADRLLEARPSMAVLRNRIDRAMGTALEAAGGMDGSEVERESVYEGDDGDAANDDGIEGDAASEDETPVPDAAAVLEATTTVLERAVTVDDEAARRASGRLEGTVMTLSRSGTVLEAIRASDARRIYVAESRPGREGVGVAESLADERPVTLHTDASAASLLSRESIDRVVVGADTIRPDGAVVNKAGTRGMTLAAVHERIPVTVVAASDKISTREDIPLESGSRNAVYGGDAAIDVANPTFDVTPAECVTDVVTERGVLESDDVSALVEEARELAAWREKR